MRRATVAAEVEFARALPVPAGRSAIVGGYREGEDDDEEVSAALTRSTIPPSPAKRMTS